MLCRGETGNGSALGHTLTYVHITRFCLVLSKARAKCAGATTSSRLRRPCKSHPAVGPLPTEQSSSLPAARRRRAAAAARHWARTSVPPPMAMQMDLPRFSRLMQDLRATSPAGRRGRHHHPAAASQGATNPTPPTSPQEPFHIGPAIPTAHLFNSPAPSAQHSARSSAARLLTHAVQQQVLAQDGSVEVE